MRDEYIRSFYQKVAKNYGLAPLSTMQDPTIRGMEVEFVLNEVNDFIQTHGVYPRVLDVGMGNAILLQCLRAVYPRLPLWGLEFTPELYELACSRQLKYASLVLGDMRLKKDFPDGKFNLVITERSLINLGSWQEQQQAIENIISVLDFPGRFIMMESFHESWQTLNNARKEMGLPPLPVSPQNTYLRESALSFIKRRGLFERQTEFGVHALSKHFYLTRVFHPTIRPHGTRGKYLKIVDFFEQGLQGKIVDGYSPIQFRSFERAL